MQMKFYSPLTADFFPNDTEDLGDDSQITIQSATHKQIQIYIPAVFFQISQMSLSPYTNL